MFFIVISDNSIRFDSGRQLVGVIKIIFCISIDIKITYFIKRFPIVLQIVILQIIITNKYSRALLTTRSISVEPSSRNCTIEFLSLPSCNFALQNSCRGNNRLVGCLYFCFSLVAILASFTN